MTRLALLMPLLLPAIGNAQEAKPSQREPVRATFLITGLHCPPCTRTVEGSLRRVKGVRTVTVDWRTKDAKIDFDESQVSAQHIAQMIASTPHMMGGGMRYGGWLALRVEGVQDPKQAEVAKAALEAVKGVTKVIVYPMQQSVGVAFGASGQVTTDQLRQALENKGLKASSWR